MKHGRDIATGVSYGVGAGALWGLVFLAPLEAAAFVLLILSVVCCVAVHRQPVHA